MVSKFAILVNILLASGVLAVPSSSSRLEARLARRHENRQSTPINSTVKSKSINHIYAPDGAVSGTQYSTNWAGAVLTESEGTFTNVTGTFTVPTPTGSDGSVAAWVGIDGATCQIAILEAGVDFTISGGKVSYQAWCAFYPDDSHDFDNFTIKAGDEIRTTVATSAKNSGNAVIENLSTGETVTKELTSSWYLCEQDAEWIMEDYGDANGGLVPLVNFGTFQFTNATASGSGSYGKNYTLDGATIYDIKQNRSVLTSVSASGNTVTLKRVEGV